MSLFVEYELSYPGEWEPEYRKSGLVRGPEQWFFAEAKRRDALGKKQERWFRVCKEALGQRVDLRVYRLKRR